MLGNIAGHAKRGKKRRHTDFLLGEGLSKIWRADRFLFRAGETSIRAFFGDSCVVSGKLAPSFAFTGEFDAEVLPLGEK